MQYTRGRALRILMLTLPVVAVLALAGAVVAGEHFYLLMFGAQQVPNNPNYSHSFATFVRVLDCPGGAAQMESHTISWLPQSLKVRTSALCAEPGANFPLHFTLRYALDSGERVSLWGPYEIDPTLYDRALRKIGLLESGQVRYKANDAGHSPEYVSNCIHAISTLSEGSRVRVASPYWGETASWIVLRTFRPWIADPEQTHDWVASALGLDDYPIIYRNFENPRSTRFRGAISTSLGRGRDVTQSYGSPR
jgi:hypothetical protein